MVKFHYENVGREWGQIIIHLYEGYIVCQDKIVDRLLLVFNTVQYTFYFLTCHAFSSLILLWLLQVVLSQIWFILELYKVLFYKAIKTCKEFRKIYERKSEKYILIQPKAEILKLNQKIKTHLALSLEFHSKNEQMSAKAQNHQRSKTGKHSMTG